MSLDRKKLELAIDEVKAKYEPVQDYWMVKWRVKGTLEVIYDCPPELYPVAALLVEFIRMGGELDD